MPSQVATAYVQIIPSAQGIGSGITQALGGDAAATSAGNSIGSKLVGTSQRGSRHRRSPG